MSSKDDWSPVRNFIIWNHDPNATGIPSHQRPFKGTLPEAKAEARKLLKELGEGSCIRIGCDGEVIYVERWVPEEPVVEAPIQPKEEKKTPRIEPNGVLVFEQFVKRGMLKVNREALEWDDPDHVYNHLKLNGINPERYGYHHPQEKEFAGKSRSELIAEIVDLRKTILSYERSGM